RPSAAARNDARAAPSIAASLLRQAWSSASGLPRRQEVSTVTDGRVANLPEPRRPGQGGPRRGYTWPPFEPGNTAAVRHGAHSERLVAPLAEQVRADLLAAAPWLESAAFESAVAAWSRVEAQVGLEIG